MYTKLIKGYTEKHWGRNCTGLPAFIIQRLPVHYCLGQLEYRGLLFETERLEEENHQGVAVMNFTEREVSYTRSVEHKHFEFEKQPITYVTKEYPADWKPGEEAYYPVNNERNQKLYIQYAELAKKEKHVIFGGRLAEYKYYDMDDVIKNALEMTVYF